MLFKKFSVFALFLVLLSCTQHQSITEMELRNETPFPDLYINNEIKIRSIVPFINQEFPTQSGIAYQPTDTNFLNEFTFEDATKNCRLQMTKLTDDVVCLGLVLETYKTQSNDDTLGITFESIPSLKKGLAIFKYGAVKAWTYPVVFENPSTLPPNDIQFALWQYANGSYAVAVPLIGGGYVSNFGNQKGRFSVKAACKVGDYSVSYIPLVALGFGTDPYKTIQNTYNRAFQSMHLGHSLRASKTYPPFFEKLMWCTWNSFGHSLSAQRVIEGLQTFQKLNITIPNLLLDDGWNQVSAFGTGMLQSLKVSKEKFPKGLSAFISEIKSKFGVERVGLWHAYTGYWAGIDPESELKANYGNRWLGYYDKVAWTNEPLRKFYIPDPMKTEGKSFFDDWHSYMKAEGIEFVKIDNQLVMDRIAKGNYPFADLAKTMQTLMQASVAKHFGGHVINCMDMTTDAVYHFGKSAVARSSEDYFPENESYQMHAGNEAVHVLCNAYNALWWSQMVWPDWDMFQTHRTNGMYHAVARAISGGPIYITDIPGKTNKVILDKLSLKDGTILRADQPALPTEDCLFTIGQTGYVKIFSISNGGGLLGVFHANTSPEASGCIRATDIKGLEGKKFAVYQYFSDSLFILSAKDSLTFKIKQRNCELYNFKSVQNKIAVFGIKNKFNSFKTLKKETIADKIALVELAEGGTLLVYSEKPPKRVVGSMEAPLPYTYTNSRLEVQVPDNQTKVAIQF